MGPAGLTPNLGWSLRGSSRSSGTHHSHQGITPGLTRDTGFRTCLRQCSSRDAEIPSSHDMEQDPGAHAKENSQTSRAEGRGQTLPSDVPSSPRAGQGQALPGEPPAQLRLQEPSLPQKRVQISQGYGMASLKLVHSCLLTHQQ